MRLKKTTCLILVIGILGVMALSGCVKKTPPPTGINETYSETEMLTAGGAKVNLSDEAILYAPEFGVGLVTPESWAQKSGSLQSGYMDQGLFLIYLPSSILQEIETASSDTAEDGEAAVMMVDKLYAQSVPFLFLFSLKTGETPDALPEVKDYASCDEVGSLNGTTYYLAYNSTRTAEESSELPAEDLEEFAVYGATIDEVKANLFLFPPQVSENESLNPMSLTSFSSTDLDGQEVTEEIFRDYDLTMVNIWATWCGPCISEMPELAALHAQLPAHVNLISICLDAEDEAEAAKGILVDSNARFITLAGTPGLSELMQEIQAFPTTVFADADGILVGDIIKGSKTAEEYMEEINLRLDELAK